MKASLRVAGPTMRSQTRAAVVVDFGAGVWDAEGILATRPEEAMRPASLACLALASALSLAAPDRARADILIEHRPVYVVGGSGQ